MRPGSAQPGSASKASLPQPCRRLYLLHDVSREDAEMIRLLLMRLLLHALQGFCQQSRCPVLSVTYVVAGAQAMVM